ncbi:mRNA-binding translational repressor [Saccharomycopsis crataegensis]|uniref:mRNA-binding translational repressor n=1 Tax=Saccharomycopsis crataegensis TaxID=43959 RepID=A0AAV5QTH6_9ASCO|nr:mRNA-binding translational repressor [Saccharomycopsis crataegensis]
MSSNLNDDSGNIDASNYLTPNYVGNSSANGDNTKKKKQLFIAHRRSPSELTALMVEQLNLQRQAEIQKQLEIVEQQKQQLLAQQQMAQLQPPTFLTSSSANSPSKNKKSHRRSQSSIASMGSMGSFSMPTTIAVPPPPTPPHNTHQHQGSFGIQYGGAGTNFTYGAGSQTPPQNKQFAHGRSGSGSQHNMGHNRRHSLGLQEAKKAAAAAQSQRSIASDSPAKDNGEHSPSTPPDANKTPEFELPKTFSNLNITPSPHKSASPRDFQFPPQPAPTVSSLLPPQPSYGGGSNQGSPARKSYHERNSSGGSYLGKSPARGHDRKGSGHYRTNSRTKDMNSNWRSQQQPQVQNQRSFGNLKEAANNSNSYDMGLAPPPAFTPSHRPKNSFSGSISSINTIASYGGFNNPPNGQQNQQQRKSLFAPYLPQANLPDLIAEGRLVTGTLRVNKKNRSDAYISTDGLLDADIFICGSKDRNRALEGDQVAVELLVVDEVWNSKKEKEEKKRRKDNTESSKENPSNGDASNDASTSRKAESGVRRRGSLKQRPTQKKNDDLEVEGQSLLLVEEEEISDEFKPLYAGHVVAVIDRIPGQLFSGTLGLVRPSQQNKDGGNSNHRPKIVWFKPNDKKVPLIAIPTDQAPKDFVENHEAYANKLFVASIKRWPITSLHPFGTLVSQLGVIDAAETEINSILRDNNFSCDEFPENFSKLLQSYGSIDELPKDFQYLTQLPKELNIVDRKDFTNEYVFGVSPTGAVCDSSIHIKRLSDAKIEIGVHISDVCYFIENGSLLDKKLKKRNVSVHLAQGVSKYLMPDHINELVSFKPGQINVAISTIFQIDTDSFEIDDVWIGESIVKPKQVITYDEIDSILNKDVEFDFTSQTNGKIMSATADYIRTLSLISKQFRSQRLNSTSMEVEPALTLLNQFDDERARLSLNIFEDNMAYPIIQEIFHKVDATIAQRIFAKLGSKAFLRRQQLPTLSKFETFIRKVSNFNLLLDTTDAASLQNSIVNIKDDVKRKAVETLLSKCMNRGKYYVAGKVDPENYAHWFYNLPLYTHFTAPTSRYADLIVHRQLKSILKNEEYTEDMDNLKMVAEYCNFKKDNALSAQHQSIHLLLCQSVNAMSIKTGQILTMGTVIQTYESSFDVLIPEFGIEKRVHGDQLPLFKAEFDKSKKVLELYWEKGVDSATYVPPDEKQPLSYRSSIKNKFRTSSLEAAKYQKKTNSKLFESEELLAKLNQLGLTVPKILSPNDIADSLDDGTSKSLGIVDDEDPMKPYFKQVVTRVDEAKNYYIQEVHELQQIPILLRSEIGMAIPCLTVRTLNPFANF